MTVGQKRYQNIINKESQEIFVWFSVTNLSFATCFVRNFEEFFKNP